MLLLFVLSPSSWGADFKPEVDILRPATGSPVFGVRAYRLYGDTKIPYGRSHVTITLGDGREWSLLTDFLGRGGIPVERLTPTLSANRETVTITARLSGGGLDARKTLSVSGKELAFYVSYAAEKLVDEGIQEARKGNMKGGLVFFKKAFALNRDSSRAAYNRALAYEKLGMSRLAVSAYSDYLLRFPGEVQDRGKVREKLIKISGGMKFKPPIHRKVLDILEQARARVDRGEYFTAIQLYELAQFAAPWWAEPYYSSAAVFEHLSVQSNFEYGENAIENWEFFIKTAAPGDARVAGVKEKLSKFRRLKEGLNAPKKIRVN